MSKHSLQLYSGLLLRMLSALVTICLLVQFFIAGMAAVTDPDWWTYHRSWVSIFQWLVLPLPILALLAGRPRWRRSACASIPLLQIALQYFLAHRALEGRFSAGMGLHAVNGSLLLVVAVLLTLGFPDDRRHRSAE